MGFIQLLCFINLKYSQWFLTGHQIASLPFIIINVSCQYSQRKKLVIFWPFSFTSDSVFHFHFEQIWTIATFSRIEPFHLGLKLTDTLLDPIRCKSNKVTTEAVQDLQYTFQLQCPSPLSGTSTLYFWKYDLKALSRKACQVKAKKQELAAFFLAETEATSTINTFHVQYVLATNHLAFYGSNSIFNQH